VDPGPVDPPGLARQCSLRRSWLSRIVWWSLAAYVKVVSCAPQTRPCSVALHEPVTLWTDLSRKGSISGDSRLQGLARAARVLDCVRGKGSCSEYAGSIMPHPRRMSSRVPGADPEARNPSAPATQGLAAVPARSLKGSMPRRSGTGHHSAASPRRTAPPAKSLPANQSSPHDLHHTSSTGAPAFAKAQPPAASSTSRSRM